MDQKICIGCGLCTVQCKFDAIHLDKVQEVWGVPYEKIVPKVIKEEGKKIGRIIARKVKA